MATNSSTASWQGALVGRKDKAGTGVPCGLVISAEPFNERSPHLIIVDFQAQSVAHSFEVQVGEGVVRADCLSQFPVKEAVILLHAPQRVLAEVLGKVSALLTLR